MLILGITTRLMMVIATAAVAAGSVYTIRYLIRLRNRLNTSIILIPLYKNKISLIVAAFLIFILIIIDIIAIAISLGNIYTLVNLLIMLFFIFALLLTMMTQRFAVIDIGIIAPYRYIDWIEFSDYGIEGNTVYFTGDKYGFKSLSSTTIKLSFNREDLNKLELILSRNKNKP